MTKEHARILVIDDEPVNLKLLEKILLREGYLPPMLVQDPRLVVDHYQAQRPDLILLDLNMPHLDGYQVMAQLQALGDPLLPPIVILTAQHGRDYQLKALAAGARDFVGKPFDRAELLMRVRNLLEAQLAHRLVHDQRTVLEELVLARTRELRESRLQIVRRLGRAAEYRDNETGAHVTRMSHVTALLARSIGWSPSECELILNASPMHDIGKIGISDTILLKPGRLTAEERSIMETHTLIGADILADSGSELLELAHQIALTHHEKWDGSGYPQGLQGEEIPMAGRIAAIADVFDALTSARPYKTPWSLKAAVDFIEDNSEKHFDPELVVHFLKNLPEILATHAQYQEVEP